MALKETKLIHIIDDHFLFSQSLKVMINMFGEYKVDFCGGNGSELIFRLQNQEHKKPDLILLDINMPIMNGLETMDWMSKHQPKIPVIILTMEDDTNNILSLLKKGIKGYLLKDVDPVILKKALDDVLSFGFHHSEKITKLLLHTITKKYTDTSELNEKEMEFIKLTCSEMTYKEIAEAMHLSPKTIDGYRGHLFEKLDVKSRVGLVMYAIKNRVVSLK